MKKEIGNVIFHTSFIIIINILFKIIFINDDYDLWLQNASSYVPIGMCVASAIAYGVYLYRAHEKYHTIALRAIYILKTHHGNFLTSYLNHLDGWEGSYYKFD